MVYISPWLSGKDRCHYHSIWQMIKTEAEKPIDKRPQEAVKSELKKIKAMILQPEPFPLYSTLFSSSSWIFPGMGFWGVHTIGGGCYWGPAEQAGYKITGAGGGGLHPSFSAWSRKGDHLREWLGPANARAHAQLYTVTLARPAALVGRRGWRAWDGTASQCGPALSWPGWKIVRRALIQNIPSGSCPHR